MNTRWKNSSWVQFAPFALLGCLICLSGCQQNSGGPAAGTGTARAAVIDKLALEFRDELPAQVAETEPASATNPPAAVAQIKTSTELALAPEAPAAAPQGTLNITFDKIKFNMEKNADFERALITPEIEKLAGRNVRLRGYILPKMVFSQTGIKFFVLVRDDQACCFGPGAMLYDCVMVYMNPGKSTDFTTGVITVEGKFSIEINKSPEGKTQAIYRMDADSAK